jgi:hypothetical protein
MIEAAVALARPNSATCERNAIIPDRIALERDAFAPARERAESFRRELPLDEAAWHDRVARKLFELPARWRANRALDLDRILSEKDSSALDGLLGTAVSHLPVPGLSPDRPISASAIQNLLGCPHAFFLGHILGFDEPPALPPQREIGQPHYGHLFHTVAAEFYARHGVSFCAREHDFPDWLLIADPIIDGVFREFVKEHPLGGEAVRAQQWERLQRDVRELLDYDWRGARCVRFVAVERPFGQPIPVELLALWDGKGQWDTRPESGAWVAERNGHGWMMDLAGLTWEEPAGLGIRQTERAYLDAERRRVIYVAATRARELAVVPRAGAVQPGRFVCGRAASCKAALSGAGCCSRRTE